MNATTDTITVSDIVLKDDDVITFSAGSGGLLPGGITATTKYIITNYVDGVFRLSDNGTPINITSWFTPPCYVNIDSVDYQIDTINRYVLKFKSDSLVHTLFGGIGIRLRLSTGQTVYNTTSKINISIYNDTNEIIAEGTPIYFADILNSSNYSEYISKFDNIALTEDTNYWVSLNLDELVVDSSDELISLYMNRCTVGNINSEFGYYSGSGYTLINTDENYYHIYSFIDDGQTSAVTTSRRGIKTTGSVSLIPSNIQVCVPTIEVPGDSGEADPSTNTRNEIIVSVIAKNGENGIPKTLIVTVPQDTARNSQFLLGTENDVFDRVVDVQIQPGATSNLRISAGHIDWSIYDLITVESVV
jgi:hypothetical protein